MAFIFGSGLVKCGVCGKPNPKDSRFCNCGAKIGEADTTGEIVDWKREPGDFARKIDLAKDDRRQYGGIIVPPGTRAVIVEDGKVVEQITAGKYLVAAIATATPGVEGSDGGLRLQKVISRIQQFWKEKGKNPSLIYPDVSALLIDAGETHLSYSIKAKTSDPLSVSVNVEVRVSLKDPILFLANKLKGNLAYTEGDVKKDFETVIQRVMEREIGKFRYDDLQSKIDDVVISLQGEANKVVERDGYSLAVLSLRIWQEGKDAADEIKSDTAAMREAGKAALEQGRVQVDLLKGQAGLENEAQHIEVQKTLDQRNRESILSDDSRLRGKKSADAEHTDTKDEVARKRERELLARGHKKEDLREDMGTEGEVKDFGRSEEIKDAKKDVAVGDLKSDAELARKAKEFKFQQEATENEEKWETEQLHKLSELKRINLSIEDEFIAAEHKRKMDEATKEREFRLEDKKIDIEGTLKGKEIDSKTAVEIKKADVDIAKVDAEGNRKLAEYQEALRKESKADGKETLEMFKQFAEKNAELLAGSAGRRVEEIKEMTGKHTDQMAKLATEKAKALGTATSKEGRESSKIQCPNPDCGAEVPPGFKFCGRCKTPLA